MENKNQIPEDVLKKLSKILAFKEGKEKTGNLEEAEIATQKANRLLLEYNLSINDIHMFKSEEERKEKTMKDLTDSEQISYRSKSIGGVWKLKLMEALARNNFCDVIYWSFNKKLIIIGTKNNADIVKQIFSSLSDVLVKIGKYKYENDYLPNFNSSNEKISPLIRLMQKWERGLYGEKPVGYDTYQRRFLNGASFGINQKLKEEVKRAKIEHKSLNELMIYNGAALEAYVKEVHKPKTKNCKTKADEIFFEGVKTGKSIDVNAFAKDKSKPIEKQKLLK